MSVVKLSQLVVKKTTQTNNKLLLFLKAEKQTKINMKLLFRKHFLVCRFINLKTQYQNDIQSIFFFNFEKNILLVAKKCFKRDLHLRS